MAEATVTINGNLTADPELRFTNSGVAVANFTVASTPRKYDKQASQWVDGDALFLRVNVWRDMAEGAADVLKKGDAVIVTGKLAQRSFETRDGDKRTVIELEADDIGKSVRPRKARGESSRAAASTAASDDEPNW